MESTGVRCGDGLAVDADLRFAIAIQEM